MAQKAKINVKERFSDGEIDLSMSDLDEVPVKEIAALRKTVSLDLSNNRLTILPNNFTSLTFLTKLNLSKNELTELPNDFGSLDKLKYLDLYRNKLERLPLSFGQLSGLKFLDLKDNPLVPTVAKVAGPCIDNKGCQQCARDIVKFFKQLQDELDTEVEMRNKVRKKQQEINQQKKQEEKKKLKKENQLNKASKALQSNDIVNNINGNTNKKKVKKEQKKHKTHKTKAGFNIIKFTFYLLLSSIIALWFLFALRWHSIQHLVPKVSEFYELLLNKLSPDYQPYGRYVGASVVSWQDKTRNVSLRCVETVYNSEIVQRILAQVRSYLDDSSANKYE